MGPAVIAIVLCGATVAIIVLLAWRWSLTGQPHNDAADDDRDAPDLTWP